MTTGQGQQAAAQAGDAFIRDYEAVRGNDAIQFAPTPPPPPPEPPPEWVQDIQRFLGEIVGAIARLFGDGWPVIKWVLLAAAIAALIAIILHFLDLFPKKAEADEDAEEIAWTPQRAQAVALLEEADRLAAEGRFEEATHLLLQRSVGHIAKARPDWLDPSSTAREIAGLPGLSAAARNAFRAISERVERSLFALRRLDAEDWRIARAAYADFALEKIGQVRA